MTDQQQPEALRAQFEQYVNPDGDVNMHWLAAGYYAGRGVQQSWLDFQAGHAAAKAETADVGEPVAWMAVVTHSRSQGPQAHFVSDAKLARQWDYNGAVDGEPCIVQPLFTAHQLAAAVAKDAEDARRLDWLTFNISGKALRDIGVIWSEHGDARRAIDAARAQQEAG